MPLYNYRCNKCNHTSEEWHSRDADMSDTPCTHVECEGTLQKLLSAVPFTFNTGPVIKDVIHHD